MQGTVLALALRPEKGGAMTLAESITLTPENGVIGEVTPCHLMDEVQTGLEAALQPNWRGGVFAQIIDPGSVEVGGNISIHSSQ